MSLKEKLAEDLKSSMKNKDTVRKNTVQLVRTAILQVEKDNKVTLDDEDILEVIAKQLKQRKDSLPEYEKSGREDLISQLKQEMECLMEYLPKQLTEDELRPIVEEGVKAVGATSMKDMGKVMEYVMPKVKEEQTEKQSARLLKVCLTKNITERASALSYISFSLV